MKQLIDEYNKVYPKYMASQVTDHTFNEISNGSKPNTLHNLTIKGINSYIIPNDIIKDATSIYDKAGSPDVLRKDNDGIILAELNGTKYILICELKSSFSSENIVKAKNQIIGAYIKLHSLFSILQSYNPTEWIIRGIIVSYTPSTNLILDLQRDLECNIKNQFLFKLQRDKKYLMPGNKCKRFFHPLNIPDILLCHLPVPDKAECFTVDFNNIIA